MKQFIYVLIILILSQTSLARSNPAYEILDIDFINNLPFVNIKIEDKQVKAMLDTGARNEVLVVSENIISQLDTTKLYNRKEKSKDLTGKEYIAIKYILPKFNIGKISYLQVSMVENTNWGLSSSNSESKGPEKDGIIGLKLFINKAIIIDYPNKKLVVMDKKYPTEYDIDNWQELKYKIDSYGISIYASIDGGEVKRFLLDTGANISIIKPSSIGDSKVKNDCDIVFNNKPCSYIKSNNFAIKDIDLEDISFYLYDFKGFEPDGILGYGFLANKIIYIDFDKRVIRIKPSI